MKKELNKNQKNIYFIICILMSFTLTNVIGAALTLKFAAPIVLIITSVMGAIATALLVYPFLFYLIVLISFITFMGINYFNKELTIMMISRTGAFIHNIWYSIRGYENLQSTNVGALWLIITFIISLMTILLLFRLKRTRIVLITYVSLLIYLWYNHIDKAYPMLMLFLLLYIVYYGLERYRYSILEQRKDREKLRSSEEIFKPWLNISISYGLIIIIIASLLPKGGSFVEWDWLHRRVTRAFPILTELREDISLSRGLSSGDLFDLTQTGFQEDSGRLGGPVKLNDRVVMEVKAPYSMYLRGNIKTKYEDNNWKYGERYQREFTTDESLPLDYAYGREVTIEITNRNLASFTLFAPYQPQRIIIDVPGRLWLDVNNQITLQAGRYKDESYQIRALTPVIRMDYNDQNNISKGMMEEYLQIPEGLPTSVRIRGGLVTNRDSTPYEKGREIEAYLRNNFTYNLDVPHTPEGRDFVDYFLNDLKEGYCTYFATAMIVMLRSIDIPARYVEGYRMEDNIVNGLYEVKQANAHAWVEAYIQGMGWVTFEPTPAFTPPVLVIENTSSNSLGTNNNQQGNNRPEDIDIDSIVTDDFDHPINDRYNNANIDEAAENALNGLRLFIPYLILILLLGVLPARVIYMFAKIKNYKKAYHNKKLGIIYTYKNILELLEKLRFDIKEGETPCEYATRIGSKLYDINHDFREITNIYIKVKYGNIDAEAKEFYQLEEYLDFINKKVKVSYGIWPYLYLKYVKGDLYTLYSKI